eukprot:GHVU01208005.1.p2 GENE.GHVU01208005.1~~GHVU01208005.1.p2  ORF type:complete len:105 (-),score=8.80 GHVU01208005.1:665-979(-)
MPRIRTLTTRKPPEGWEKIEPTLEELNQKMRDAEKEPHEGKRKCEAVWPILKINHQRSSLRIAASGRHACAACPSGTWRMARLWNAFIAAAEGAQAGTAKVLRP